jgi:Fe-S cluster biosynthesis and repair protein YggX
MNFEEYLKQNYPKGFDSKITEFQIKEAWYACKQEVLKIINETPLGYRTEGEHEKLERFADLVFKKVEKL